MKRIDLIKGFFGRAKRVEEHDFTQEPTSCLNCISKTRILLLQYQVFDFYYLERAETSGRTLRLLLTDLRFACRTTTTLSLITMLNISSLGYPWNTWFYLFWFAFAQPHLDTLLGCMFELSGLNQNSHFLRTLV